MALSRRDVRAELIDLNGYAYDELASFYSGLDGLPPNVVRASLADALPELGDAFQLAASSLAADWYDDLRAELNIRGNFAAAPTAPVDVARWDALAGYGVSPLFGEVPDYGASRALVFGGLQRTIANAHRDTIAESSIADPKAVGWARFGTGKTCAFCAMLIGRGAVYREKASRFKSHDNCSCVASPVFEDADRVDGFL